jgi:hypothetical protein
MNERIKLLAEQAGMIIVDDRFSTYGKFAEKFAELIVKECISMADEFEIDVNRSGLVDRMKEHFGVK